MRSFAGDSAEKAKAQFSSRFIPTRFVVTRPCPDEFEARWCLRGYLDPDVMELVGSGSTQSLTVSQLGRMLPCQLIVSNGWNVQLGDIRGAFLEADNPGQETRAAVLESSSRWNSRSTRWSSDSHSWKHQCFNDAPQRWWKKLMRS